MILTIKVEGGIKMSNKTIVKKLDEIEETVGELYRMVDFKEETWPLPEQAMEKVEKLIEEIKLVLI